MKITIDRAGAPFHFVAENSRGQTVSMDEPEEAGGTGQGVSPMQMLIMALGGCSGIDIALILDRQRLSIDRFSMELEAKRPEGEGQPYDRIHAHYVLEGDIPPAKAKRAVELSLNKYCGVTNTLRPTARITASVSLNGEQFDVDVAETA